MASLDFSGLDELNAAFARMAEIPERVTANALSAMAEVAAKKIKSRGEAAGIRDPESSVHILDKIKASKPKITDSGGYADITFQGARTRGRTKTRNAEIAFVNEYGKRGQQARPFIGTAMTQSEQAIVDAGAEVLGDYIEKNF